MNTNTMSTNNKNSTKYVHASTIIGKGEVYSSFYPTVRVSENPGYIRIAKMKGGFNSKTGLTRSPTWVEEGAVLTCSKSKLIQFILRSRMTDNSRIEQPWEGSVRIIKEEVNDLRKYENKDVVLHWDKYEEMYLSQIRNEYLHWNEWRCGIKDVPPPKRRGIGGALSLIEKLLQSNQCDDMISISEQEFINVIPAIYGDKAKNMKMEEGVAGIRIEIDYRLVAFNVGKNQYHWFYTNEDIHSWLEKYSLDRNNF